MKFLNGAVLFAILLAPVGAQAQIQVPVTDEGCTFAVVQASRTVSLAESVSAISTAMADARSASERACRDAGWSDCQHDGYPGFTDYSGDQVTIQYRVPVSSAECAEFVANPKNSGKFAARDGHFIRLEKARPSPVRVSEDCKPGTILVEESSAVNFLNSGVPANESRGREIPGDGDGTGRRKN